MIRSGFLFAFSAFSALAGEASAVPLPPMGGWSVDYGEAQCLAVRRFQIERDGVILSIRPSFNGETQEILLTRIGSAPALAKEESGTIDFGAGPQVVPVLSYKAKGVGLAIHRLRVPSSAQAQLRSSKWMEVTAFGATTRVESGPLGSVLKALDTCLADLKSHWNNAPETAARVRASAKGDIRHVFSHADYPSEALSRLQEGTAQYILLIDPNGRVAGCDLVKPSGVLLLDFMGCQAITQRARFTPALDADGKPTRDTIVTPPIRWVVQ